MAHSPTNTVLACVLASTLYLKTFVFTTKYKSELNALAKISFGVADKGGAVSLCSNKECLPHPQANSFEFKEAELGG